LLFRLAKSVADAALMIALAIVVIAGGVALVVITVLVFLLPILAMNEHGWGWFLPFVLTSALWMVVGPRAIPIAERLVGRTLRWTAALPVSSASLDWFARLWALSAFVMMFCLPVIPVLTSLLVPTRYSPDVQSQAHDAYAWYAIAFVQLPPALAFIIARRRRRGVEFSFS
jgi:hypothetical protein